jgi:uncharacterized protein YeaO (DUF488 family)
MLLIKRVYDPVDGAARSRDGARFLVDRLWPRGIRKDELLIEGWLRELAPSAELRKWFQHDPTRWAEFKQRYHAELAAQPALCQPLLDAARKGNVTLLYSARDTVHNNAAALAEYLQSRL